MLKLLPLVLRNIDRNRRRTLLTILSLAIPFYLLMTLQTVVDSMDAYLKRSEKSQRLAVYNKMGLVFDIPESHIAKLLTIPGVQAVCPLTWYGGLYRGPKDMLNTLSVDARTFRQVWPEGIIPDSQYAEFRSQRIGCLLDQRIALKFGWVVGDEMTLRATVRPVDLKFKVCGIIKDSCDPNGFFFHREYLEEALGKPGIVTNMWVQVDSAQNLSRVQSAAEEMFANSPFEVKAEQEKAFVSMFLSMSGNIQGLVQGIGTVVVAIIMLVAANSIAMSVRERTREVAVMKALGFAPAAILCMILAESALLGLAAGLLGSWTGYLVYSTPYTLSFFGALSGLFIAPLGAATKGILLAPLLGCMAGIVPAWTASRMRVVDALRRLA